MDDELKLKTIATHFLKLSLYTYGGCTVGKWLDLVEEVLVEEIGPTKEVLENEIIIGMPKHDIIPPVEHENSKSSQVNFCKKKGDTQ